MREKDFYDPWESPLPRKEEKRNFGEFLDPKKEKIDTEIVDQTKKQSIELMDRQTDSKTTKKDELYEK